MERRKISTPSSSASSHWEQQKDETPFVRLSGASFGQVILASQLSIFFYFFVEKKKPPQSSLSSHMFQQIIERSPRTDTHTYLEAAEDSILASPSRCPQASCQRYKLWIRTTILLTTWSALLCKRVRRAQRPCLSQRQSGLTMSQKGHGFRASVLLTQ